MLVPILVAIAHTATAWAGFRLLAVPGTVGIIWPATGLLLGVLLLLPLRLWPATLSLAAVTAAVLQPALGVARLWLGAWFSALGVAEAALAALILLRWRPAVLEFRSVADLTALMAAGAGSAALVGAIAAHSLRMLELDADQLWTVWASGHTVAVLLVTPLILTYSRPSLPGGTPLGVGRIAETVGALGLLTVVSLLIFFDGVGPISAPRLLSLPYQVLPFLVLVAARYGVRSATLGAVVVSFLAVTGTAAGGQAFALTHPVLGERVVILQWFTALAALVAVLLALAMEQARWQEYQARLLNDALAEANGVLVHEIGERERSALSLRMLLDAAPEGIVVVDEQGLIVEVNGALEAMFGYTRGQLLGMPGDRLVDESERDMVRDYRLRYVVAPEEMLHRGTGADLVALRSDGRTFPAQVGLSPYRLGDQLRIIATVRDVTDQRAVERRIEASLREKEVLLREVHHRVKNNMAVMSSLFYLQQRHATDPETVKVFQESASRVRSMAMVHEVLYRSDDVSAVDFSRYLEALIDHLTNVYRGTVPGLQVVREIAPLRLSLDQAVPCGLLLNELLTNAFKHAFVDDVPPELLVRASSRHGEVRIEIVDNGVGVPQDLSPDRTQTLGMRLMLALTEQLDGTLETERLSRGTRSRLAFPLVVGRAIGESGAEGASA